jgi:hypothetical protein
VRIDTSDSTYTLPMAMGQRKRHPASKKGTRSSAPTWRAGCSVTGVSPVHPSMPLPVSVLWTAQNRRCVVHHHDTQNIQEPLIEIVVYEHERVLKRKFFVDSLQAADFAVTEFMITTDRARIQ